MTSCFVGSASQSISTSGDATSITSVPPATAPGAGQPMRVISVHKSKVAYPTGDPKFKVMQSFPAAISAEQADPFLMCDFFGPSKSNGIEEDPDSFPVQWHPHRGMDICTYLVEGIGRHADSLGNREEFLAPGLQWCSVGSGIEHAEGGGTPNGLNTTGFQIWINVPSNRKMDDPRYGTVSRERMPELKLAGGQVHARVVAGPLLNVQGPFETVQPLQMVDYVLQPGAVIDHEVPADLDTCMLLVYRGSVDLLPGNEELKIHHVALFDASDKKTRMITLRGGAQSGSVMVFAGKKLKQPIAWHGPIVMTTQEEIRQTFMELRRGTFPPKRVAWDYKNLADFPLDHPAKSRLISASKSTNQHHQKSDL